MRLTSKEEKIFNEVRDFLSTQHSNPTFTLLAQHSKYPKTTLFDNLKQLIKKGYLTTKKSQNKLVYEILKNVAKNAERTNNSVSLDIANSHVANSQFAQTQQPKELTVKTNVLAQEVENPVCISDILSKNQKSVYNFIVRFVKLNRYSPLSRDIQKHCGFSSPATVHKYLNILEYGGYIIRGKRNTVIAGLPKEKL